MKVMRNKTMVKKQATAGGLGFIAAVAILAVAEKFFNVSKLFEVKEEQPETTNA